MSPQISYRSARSASEEVGPPRKWTPVPRLRVGLARRGLSYMEVLIAAAIGLAGMLGAIAIYPVASVSLQNGIVADAMTAIGPSAQRQVKSLELNDPTRWVFNANTAGLPATWMTVSRKYNGTVDPRYPVRADMGGRLWFTDPPLPNATRLLSMESFCFDPRMLAEVTTWNTTEHNPFQFPSTMSPSVRMRRVTLANGLSGAAAGRMTTQQARTIFKVSDDLIFARPEDALGVLPASQSYLFDERAGNLIDDDGNGVVDDAPEQVAQRRDYFAEFEWIVTASPQLIVEPSLGTINTGKYDLSIVVFHQRNPRLDTIISHDPAIDPTFVEDERVVDVSFSNGAATPIPTTGIGGGDLVIVPRAGRPDSDIALRPNQWVMLHGMIQRQLRLSNGTTTTVSLPLFQWYRVANTSVASNDSRLRFVTLEGPDWPVAQTQSVSMAIISGVVGVFHDTMQLK